MDVLLVEKLYYFSCRCCQGWGVCFLILDWNESVRLNLCPPPILSESSAQTTTQGLVFLWWAHSCNGSPPVWTAPQRIYRRRSNWTVGFLGGTHRSTACLFRCHTSTGSTVRLTTVSRFSSYTSYSGTHTALCVCRHLKILQRWFTMRSKHRRCFILGARIEK